MPEKEKGRDQEKEGKDFRNRWREDHRKNELGGAHNRYWAWESREEG